MASEVSELPIELNLSAVLHKKLIISDANHIRFIRPGLLAKCEVAYAARAEGPTGHNPVIVPAREKGEETRYDFEYKVRRILNKNTFDRTFEKGWGQFLEDHPHLKIGSTIKLSWDADEFFMLLEVPPPPPPPAAPSAKIRLTHKRRRLEDVDKNDQPKKKSDKGQNDENLAADALLDLIKGQGLHLLEGSVEIFSGLEHSIVSIADSVQHDATSSIPSFLEIAVKRLKVWSDKAELEFVVEIEVLARIRHKNLLTLRGYCAEGQERLIVYDFMPNSSLLSHLHGQHSAECLIDWKKRMNIAIGSAEAIVYLHNHASPHIIHRDIKASNVLLDSDFQAKVADFGFARFVPDGATHVTTRVKGTLGYLDPEYAMLGKASESCNVYSYGILLLEIASGRRAIQKLNMTSNRSITDWALPLAREENYIELADPKLNGNFVKDELKRLILVALVCAQKKPERRPTMLEVVELLKGEAKDKLTNLENKLFKSWQSADDKDEIGEDNADSMSERKEDAPKPKSKVEETVQEENDVTSKSESTNADSTSEEKDDTPKPDYKISKSGSEDAQER